MTLDAADEPSSRFAFKGLHRGLCTLIRASLAAHGGKASVAQLSTDIAPFYARLKSDLGMPLLLPLQAGLLKALSYLDPRHTQRGYVCVRDPQPPSEADVARVRAKAPARVCPPPPDGTCPCLCCVVGVLYQPSSCI